MSERSLTTVAAKPALTSAVGVLQRKCDCGQHTIAGGECEECKTGKVQLQRRSAGSSSRGIAPPIVHEVLRSPGQPLDISTRSFFESRFGQDLSHVRVHTDTRAAESAKAVDALAYTVGHNVVFGTGRYTPTTKGGTWLLAHELAHTIQQKGAPVQSLATFSVDSESSPSEHAANSAADAVLANRAVSALGGSGIRVQRQRSTGNDQETVRIQDTRIRYIYFEHARDVVHPSSAANIAALTVDLRESFQISRIRAFTSPEGPMQAGPGFMGNDELSRRRGIAATRVATEACRTAGVADSSSCFAGGKPVSPSGESELYTIAPLDSRGRRHEVEGAPLAEHAAAEFLRQPAEGPHRTPALTERLTAPAMTSQQRAELVYPLLRRAEITLVRTRTETHSRPQPSKPGPRACISGPGKPNTDCSAYVANAWWLPLAYVNNATCACSSTPNVPTANCVRKILQDRLAATTGWVKALAVAQKPLELNPLTHAGYQAFVQSVLTPRIYADHVHAYRTCCCPSGPAVYPAWVGVTSVPIQPCSLVGLTIRYFGSCHGTPGAW